VIFRISNEIHDTATENLSITSGCHWKPVTG